MHNGIDIYAPSNYFPILQHIYINRLKSSVINVVVALNKYSNIWDVQTCQTFNVCLHPIAMVSSIQI